MNKGELRYRESVKARQEIIGRTNKDKELETLSPSRTREYIIKGLELGHSAKTTKVQIAKTTEPVHWPDTYQKPTGL